MQCKLLCAAVVASAFALSGGTEADDCTDTASQTSVRKTGQEKSPRQIRELSAEERDAVREWWEMTSLMEGEVLKRIAPPFPECRAVYHRAMHRAHSLMPELPDVMCIRWRPGNERSGGSNRENPVPLSFLFDSLLDIAVERQEIEGDVRLLNSSIDGDWIVREGVPAREVLPQLVEILRNQCELPVKLRIDQVEQEVIVVKGTYHLAETSGRSEIRLHGRVFTERAGGGGSGSFERFVQEIGSFIGRRIVSEVVSPPEGRLKWRHNSPSPKVEGWDDRDQDTVLAHLSKQTGLAFVNEKKTVPVVFVDYVE